MTALRTSRYHRNYAVSVAACVITGLAGLGLLLIPGAQLVGGALILGADALGAKIMMS